MITKYPVFQIHPHQFFYFQLTFILRSKVNTSLALALLLQINRLEIAALKQWNSKTLHCVLDTDTETWIWTMDLWSDSLMVSTVGNNKKYCPPTRNVKENSLRNRISYYYDLMNVSVITEPRAYWPTEGGERACNICERRNSNMAACLST